MIHNYYYKKQPKLAGKHVFHSPNDSRTTATDSVIEMENVESGKNQIFRFVEEISMNFQYFMVCCDVYIAKIL